MSILHYRHIKTAGVNLDQPPRAFTMYNIKTINASNSCSLLIDYVRVDLARWIFYCNQKPPLIPFRMDFCVRRRFCLVREITCSHCGLGLLKLPVCGKKILHRALGNEKVEPGEINVWTTILCRLLLECDTGITLEKMLEVHFFFAIFSEQKVLSCHVCCTIIIPFI